MVIEGDLLHKKKSKRNNIGTDLGSSSVALKCCWNQTGHNRRDLINILNPRSSVTKFLETDLNRSKSVVKTGTPPNRAEYQIAVEIPCSLETECYPQQAFPPITSEQVSVLLTSILELRTHKTQTFDLISIFKHFYLFFCFLQNIQGHALLYNTSLEFSDQLDTKANNAEEAMKIVKIRESALQNVGNFVFYKTKRPVYKQKKFNNRHSPNLNYLKVPWN